MEKRKKRRSSLKQVVKTTTNEKTEKTKKTEENAEETKSEVPEIPLFIADFMGKLLNQEKYYDVEFHVGETSKRFKAHKLVLAAHSPLFETMLYGPTQSSPVISDTIMKVNIKDVKPDAFDALLKAIYTDKIDVNDDNLEDLTIVGKKYQIEKIQLACATYMQQGITVKNVCQMFESASRLLGDDRFGIAFIRENIEEIFKSDSFIKLTQKRLEVIISDDKLAADEAVILEAVVKWGKGECKRKNIPGNIENLKVVLKDILQYVRFPTMDLEQIATVVGPSKLVPEENLLLLYQYLSIVEDDKEIGGDDKEVTDKLELSQLEDEKKAREECTKKIELLYNIKRRAGDFVAKDCKLLDRKFKKEIYKMFCIKPGGRLVMKLIYRGSRDGFTADIFHTKCDGQPRTLTVVKAKNSDNIFGGYFEGEWARSGSYVSAKSWLFSLVNRHKKPVKLLPSSSSSNVYQNSSYGPTWGGGHDLHINNNMQANSNYSSPSTYKVFAPGYEKLGVNYDSSLFAGTSNFSVEEIEVLQVVKITKVKKD